MPDLEFFRTRMGARFYEGTMPKVADQLERLNKNFEALNKNLEAFVAELRRSNANPTAPASEATTPA